VYGNTYVAFGLNVSSQFPLPAVPEGHDTRFDTVYIRKARPNFDWAGLLNEADAGDYFVAALKTGDLRYAVVKGKRMIFCPSKSVSDDMATFMMQTMATGAAFTILLRQRGLLTLHASVIRRAGKTIGFVGDSGYGKSTLAEYFSQQGYQLLSDDVAALSVSGDKVDVRPGYPLVKLHRPSADSLLRSDDSLQKMMDGRTFVTKSVNNFDPVPLDRLYLLEDSFHQHTKLLPVNSQAFIFQLVQHTHGSQHLVRDDYQSRLLEQCATVARTIPARVLRRKKGLEQLPSVLKIVERDLDISRPASAFDDAGSAQS